MKTNRVYIKTSTGIEIPIEKIDVEQRQPASIYILGRRDPIESLGRQEITAKIPFIRIQTTIQDQIVNDKFDVYIIYDNYNQTNILKNCMILSYSSFFYTNDIMVIQNPTILVRSIYIQEIQQKGRTIEIDTTSYIEELLKSE